MNRLLEEHYIMGQKEIQDGSCGTETRAAITTVRNPIPEAVSALSKGFKQGRWASHIEPVPIPSKSEVIDLIEQLQRILFPGFFSPVILRPENLDYHLGQQVSLLYENLAEQISSAVRHDCFRHDQSCSRCGERSYETAADLIESLPEIRNLLESDIEATLTGDPAAANSDEVIFSYPGLFATMVYRLAHRLHQLEVPLIPRIMSEHAYHRTAIDINPRANIGSHFFIDHGSGVVVGATSTIGNRVRIYQGVTLGALSLPRDAGVRLRDIKRHPTIEDDVIIYANATILGGETVVGARSIIGGNVWLTESVGPDTRVMLEPPRLVYIGPDRETK
ncbi:serine O-acetyltransferase [Desulfobulbus alkaliphilus]|uniref:serine O-acetyltransferase n=1 Tax=Desulfobulbus alkaliphilus TaxID=869814 RepID=UPI0019627316|nr:serine acetyltransferase [Desulfobulbus alkaliphilus]MBM9537012.1 serine acetyltransferase [Desulfobulbus alkaliphilus]